MKSHFSISTEGIFFFFFLFFTNVLRGISYPGLCMFTSLLMSSELSSYVCGWAINSPLISNSHVEGKRPRNAYQSLRQRIQRYGDWPNFTLIIWTNITRAVLSALTVVRAYFWQTQWQLFVLSMNPTIGPLILFYKILISLLKLSKLLKFLISQEGKILFPILC